MLCVVTNMSLKYHKFHFLFVVLHVIRNEQVVQVLKKVSKWGETQL